MKVYIIGPAEGPYKVGIAGNPKKRLCELQVGSYQKLFLHFVRRCASRDEAVGIEAAAHAALGDRRLLGEWFACSLENAQRAVGEETGAVHDEVDVHDEFVMTPCNEAFYQQALWMLQQFTEDSRRLMAGAMEALDCSPEAIALLRTKQWARTGR